MKIKYPSTPFWNDFRARKDLEVFGSNALLLFALQLKLRIEDISTVASTSLTDGPDDKGADLVYIDSESRMAIIAQCYFAQKFGKREANAKKAAQLTQATVWLLGSREKDMPTCLESHARELHEAIKNNQIDNLYYLYVHNCGESKNVEKELKRVELTASTIIHSNYKQINSLDVRASEIGLETLEKLYRSIDTPILVDKKYSLKIDGGYFIKQADWRAYITAISGDWLVSLFKEFRTDLFSANVRDYLGSRKSDKNINENIKQTAVKNPEHFLVFNNGITILTHDFKIEQEGKLLKINGVAVINGAQTTGALGSLNSRSLKKPILVQVRFVVCKSNKTLRSIVNYNNSQNRINAPDFRSNDSIQKRLVTEFLQLKSIQYLPRRGGSEDIIKRNPNMLPSVTAGQALAAFHGHPGIAYHQKTKMWEEDFLYSSFFNENTTAKHILFTYCLLKAIQDKKNNLLTIEKKGGLKGVEIEQLEFYRKRGSIFMMLAAIAKAMEIILDRKIANYFRVIFNKKITSDDGNAVFKPIVDICSSFCRGLDDGLRDGFKSEDTVNSAVEAFARNIEAIKEANKEQFANFSKEVAL
ncbi:AIPR family protein [Patescibacteria group bacterium]|nr:AIPR family protein [Patescibacteria group bacterium]